MGSKSLQHITDGLEVVPHQVRFTEEGLEGRQAEERVQRAFGEHWESEIRSVLTESG